MIKIWHKNILSQDRAKMKTRKQSITIEAVSDAQQSGAQSLGCCSGRFQQKLSEQFLHGQSDGGCSSCGAHQSTFAHQMRHVADQLCSKTPKFSSTSAVYQHGQKMPDKGQQLRQRLACLVRFKSGKKT